MSTRLPKGLSIVSIGDITVAKLYETNIVQIDKSKKSLILRTGGWYTSHTKKCMNLILVQCGAKVYQKEKIWYFEDHKGNIQMFQNDTVEWSLV